MWFVVSALRSNNLMLSMVYGSGGVVGIVGLVGE